MTITGNLSRFGYDAQEGTVVVRYDAAMAPCRRHRASRPAASRHASPPTALRRRSAPAINAAANRVAMEVAQWVGGS